MKQYTLSQTLAKGYDEKLRKELEEKRKKSAKKIDTTFVFL